jgi:spore germination protein YaaH
MFKKWIKWIGIIFGGILIGVIIGYGFFYAPLFADDETLESVIEHSVAQKEVIGFLPYWLLSKAQTDYSPFITTLTYFGLTVDVDGSILKETAPNESEPGWYTLKSGKAEPFLKSARNKNLKLSLLVFAGKPDSINQLIANPELHANTLIDEITPIMRTQQFTDLNLDIESTHEASDEARVKFTRFVKAVKQGMDKNKLGTLTVEIAPDMLVKKGLIDISQIKDSIDQLVLMAYDYHYIGSQVTGPIAPLLGAGDESEFDVNVSVKLALEKIAPEKLILGLPVYGYQWETLRESTRSATIPSSGLSVSTRFLTEHIKDCANCVIKKDVLADEKYITYPDLETGTFYQAFYPDRDSTQSKIDLANFYHLNGLALWALGYEGGDVLEPLKKY